MSKQQIGDQRVEPIIKQDLNEIARGLDAILNPGELGGLRRNGFVLMVFPFTDALSPIDRCNYISNADREDVLLLLKEQIRYMEKQIVQ